MLKFDKKHITVVLWIYIWLLAPEGLFAQNIESKDSLSNISDTSVNPNQNPQKNPKKGLSEIIEFHAKDSMSFNLAAKRVFLYRESDIKSAQTHLKAYEIDVDLVTKELFARGTIDSMGHYIEKPELQDKADKFTADSMRYNSSSGKGRVYGLKLVQDQAYIHLGTVLKQNDGSFTGVQGKITTCDADHPHFFLNSSKVKVMPNNKALFGPANLVFADIPTPFALPFGLAPLKKGQQSGLIFPSVGFNGANSSFYIQNIGYYLGLGPYSDLQINSDAYLNGDFRLGLQTQYFRRYKFRGNLAVQYSRFSNGYDEASPQFARNADFNIRSNFNIDPKLIPGITFNGNINVVTKGFNQRNSRDLNSLANNQFTSSINYSRAFFKRKLNVSMSARHSQNTQNGDFRLELPSVNLGVSSLTPFASKIGNNSKWYQQIRLSYSGDIANNIQTKDTIIFSDRYMEAFNSLRSGMRHSIPISTNFKFFNGILNFSPSFNYRENWHLNGQLKSWDTATDKVVNRDTFGFFRQYGYNFSGNLKTNIYGTINNLKIGNLRAIRHTITPTVGMTYTPEIDPFKRNWTRSYTDSGGRIINYQFFEKSPIGNLVQRESGNINFGINNNFQGKKVTKKDSTSKNNVEKFNIIDQLNISGNYNLFADSMNWSDIRLSFNTVVFKKLRINSNAGYSPYVRTATGRTINQFAYKEGQGLLRFRTAGINVNTTFSASDFSKEKASQSGQLKPKKLNSEEEPELRDINVNRMNYYDFNIPWSVNFAYMMNYNAESLTPSNRLSTSQFTVSGDLSITENWKIGYQTGYDFRRREVAASSFSVVRNLHCWQLEFSWIPNGYGKQWLFTLRPVSRLLQDLKLKKKVMSNPFLM